MRKSNQSDLLFLVAYTVFLVTFILEMSFYAKYIGDSCIVIYLVCMALLMGREILFGKLSRKSIGVLLILILMMALGAKVSRMNIVYIIMFVFAGRNISFNKIARRTIWVTCFMLCFVVLSSYLGIIENYSSRRSNGEIRYYLGFRYALFAPAFFINVSMLLVYLKKGKLKLINYIFILGFSYWFYKMTNSRLSFYMTLIILGVTLFYKQWIALLKRRKLVGVLMCLSFLIFAIGSMYIILTYNRSIAWKNGLNKILAGRLAYGQQAFMKYGISLLGQRIQWIGNGLDLFGKKAVGDYMYVDCLYLQILLNYGVLFFLAFLAIFTFVSFVTLKNRDYWLLTMLFFLAVHCIIDDNSLNLGYCTFWFGISEQLLITRKKRKVNGESLLG